MAKMGFHKLNELIGRCDLLEPAEPLNEKVKVNFTMNEWIANHLPN